MHFFGTSLWTEKVALSYELYQKCALWSAIPSMNEDMSCTQCLLYKVPFPVWIKLWDLLKMCFIKWHSLYEWSYEIYSKCAL